TIDDLEKVSHSRSIQRGTPLVGVTGFDELPYLNAALLNAALANLGVPTRVLPLAIGDLQVFRKVLKALKLGSVVIDREHASRIRQVVPDLKASATLAEAVDFLTYEEDAWQGYNLTCRAWLAALELALRDRPGGKGMQGRMVMLVGAGGVANVLGAAVQHLGGIPIVADRDRERAQGLAKTLGCRFVLPEAVYTTLHDVLIRC